jgi:hypothetical protein
MAIDPTYLDMRREERLRNMLDCRSFLPGSLSCGTFLITPPLPPPLLPLLPLPLLLRLEL